MSKRYTVVEDPCGLFFIWDENLLEPAMMGEDILAFVRRDSAGRIARVLNARANDDSGRRAIGGTSTDIVITPGHLVKDAGRAGVKLP